MKPIVECVPNFSEGRNKQTILAIAKVIESVSGVRLLHIDVGSSANRTVYTFAGEPQAVADAAYSAMKVAAELIDMRLQTGEHPRMGATDVCPLIPVSGISMDEVVVLAQKLSERVGQELQIPVYHYEYNSSQPHRKRLEQIRSGEYEGFAEKMKSPNWKPDCGPLEFSHKTGATVIGARKFLLAYNINLETKDVAIAKYIASRIRESGYMLEKDGIKERIAGSFTNLKAIGWYIDQFDKVQVSTNITDYSITPIHEVFEKIKQIAVDQGTTVTGSELIGLIPQDALLHAGIFYASKQNMPNLTTDELLELAVAKLGLSEVRDFSIDEKVLERVINYL